MEYFFSRAGLQILTRLTRERTLFAFDFDGTLSPIVQHPGEAGMSEKTRDLLASLAAARPCVIVSGRARTDLLGRLDGIPLAQAIGNHGAETGLPARSSQRRVGRWKAALEPALEHVEGVWVEDKGLSLAVHYRLAPDRAEAQRRILAAARNLTRVRVFGGKRVVNLVPDDAPHKGMALAAERDRLRCDWVFYVGDDETDEDAFALAGNTVPVRVGRNQHSHARYYLCSQAEVDKLLEILVRKTVPRRPGLTTQKLRTQALGSHAMPVDRR